MSSTPSAPATPSSAATSAPWSPRGPTDCLQIGAELGALLCACRGLGGPPRLGPHPGPDPPIGTDPMSVAEPRQRCPIQSSTVPPSTVARSYPSSSSTTPPSTVRWEALLAGGITIAEITLRTSAGLGGIRLLSDQRAAGRRRFGAGADQVDQVVDAGAHFVVSPGLSTAVLDQAAVPACRRSPASRPSSDLMVAAARGLSEVKIFPAGLLGGPAIIKALSAPSPDDVHALRRGQPRNMDDYLALPMVRPSAAAGWSTERCSIPATTPRSPTAHRRRSPPPCVHHPGLSDERWVRSRACLTMSIRRGFGARSRCW